MLMPVLMVEGNRKINMRALNHAIQYCNVDKIVINDQEFLDTDYVDHDKVEYIGHHKERQGFVNARNQLLEWFYASDYDWAVWLDGNSRITETTINDFDTIVDRIRAGVVQPDVISSTLGIIFMGVRIQAKQMKDHLNVVRIAPSGRRDPAGIKDPDLMHGLFMKNFKKVYDMEVYIHKDCNPHIGLSEDLYFVRLLKHLFDVYVCPTIIITKPTAKASTWRDPTKKTYDYPTPDYRKLDSMVRDTLKTFGRDFKRNLKKVYVYPRTSYMKEKVVPYKPKPRRKRKGGLIK